MSMCSPDVTQRLRESLVTTMQALDASGLNVGTTGNASVRCGDGLLITPSAVPADRLTPDQIVMLSLDGRIEGAGKPSSEWRFHCDVLRAKPEVNALVHTHSTHASALACTGRSIPAFHYMVAVAGGHDIPCAPYATFGTAELSHAVVQALEARRACLLANHGVIATAADLDSARMLVGYVEHLAEMYAAALRLGDVKYLDAAQMDEVLAKFAGYGGLKSDRD